MKTITLHNVLTEQNIKQAVLWLPPKEEFAAMQLCGMTDHTSYKQYRAHYMQVKHQCEAIGIEVIRLKATVYDVGSFMKTHGLNHRSATDRAQAFVRMSLVTSSPLPSRSTI